MHKYRDFVQSFCKEHKRIGICSCIINMAFVLMVSKLPIYPRPFLHINVQWKIALRWFALVDFINWNENGSFGSYVDLGLYILIYIRISLK